MDISTYLVAGARAHLAGIGGVSMSPLAEVLHGMGLRVQGSDMNESPAVARLRDMLAEGDAEGLREKMRLSTERRAYFDI